MAVTAKKYLNATFNAYKGLITDISAAGTSIKVALLASTYTPDQDAHESWDDVSAHEVTGTGYTAGGATLANKSLALDTGSNYITFDADNVTWASSTITARYAVIYDDTPAADADKKLLGYVDFGADESSSNADFTITWNTDGVFRTTVS